MSKPTAASKFEYKNILVQYSHGNTEVVFQMKT